MDIAFVICLVVGMVALLGAFLVGELADLGADVDGLPFLSLTVVATGLFGFGAGGVAGTWAGLGTVAATLLAVGLAIVLVVGTRGLLLPYLLRQQANSHIGRTSYIGSIGTVTLAVEPGGWGEVSFVDPEGNRVLGRAVSDEPVALTPATTVYIADVDDQYLHVVAIDDAN
ncbi:hypothetical protein G4H71_14705 [Rhodococcus triatomae]|uniref:NfeD-like C-terminal, partner-binding n=1 Tax=Rhodococcus triatomae TaxID=300028 RepID=A0A1G8NDK6_9NOCA|nr:NfeD family protein [Rhodococcus triatomae]QNG19973.1 hypothetical protein G4H72_15670 [Rhodococcus triatomae]QNG24112.1 hypothetical protein G4H71_14705 [Rhodococcus triatomae]SDI78176.1 hypothetical protein SAMN05444695_11131 [Rhodococcus triatomae]